MKVRAVIIDDEQNNIENLKSLLSEYCKDIEILGSSSKPRNAIELVKILDPDLIFLDIEMPEFNGFELLTKLGDINSEIIFVTAFNSYAIKAIRFNALDYILKPINIDELVIAVERAKQKLEDKKQRDITRQALANLNMGKRNKRIALASSDKIEFYEISNLIRCQGENNYTRFYFEDGIETLVSKPLNEYEELLNEHGFFRVHKSHLINLQKIKSYIKRDGGYLKTSDDSSIPVSRRRKEEVLEILKNQEAL